MRFWYKACPRCAGDLQLREEIDDAYIRCIQCGLELDPLQEAFLKRRGYVPQDVRAAVQALYEGAWRWSA